MSGLLREYILKGVYLGLLIFVALQEPSGTATLEMAACTFGGLALFLGVAAWRKLLEGYRVAGRVPAFILFLLLESPGLVYAGVLSGTVLGALLVRKEGSEHLFLPTFLGGIQVGFLFWIIRHMRKQRLRIGLSCALAVLLVCGGLYWFHLHPDIFDVASVRTMFGLNLLLGIPVFYLLTFAGLAEESEVEIGAMCAALGLGFWTLAKEYFNYQSICFLVPLVIYFWYTTRVLPNLRVFKHTVRGIGYANVARYRPALVSFRRALQLDPNNTLARENLWSLHRSLDMAQLAQEPETLAMVDFEMCLERAGAILVEPGPSPDKLKEAHHLLDLVLSQRPALTPVVHYWRAVAHTHARQLDQAGAELVQVLDSSGYSAEDPQRARILLSAWQLALVLHAELNRRVGTPQLAQTGRRLEAIAAVERRLAEVADDADAWTLKRLLYSNLTEAEYVAAQQTKSSRHAPRDEPVTRSVTPTMALDTIDFTIPGLANFDHAYAQQLGQALIADPGRWQRGVEYLRVAGRGLPGNGPTIFQQVAQAHERAGNPEDVRRSYELAKRAGRTVGPANLGPEDKQTYFAILKMLGDQARARNDVDAAIESYQLYTENERSGLETLRILAELYEQRGQSLAALRVTEKALLYDAADKDLLARKDKYYYSVTPDELRANLESIRHAFDVNYCLTKARSVLEMRELDADMLDWAHHLVSLVQVLQPDSIAVKVLRARTHRRRGEIEEAQKLFEEARGEKKPESFASREDEEAWFLCCRLLGEMYLYELSRPDLAVPCFTAFRESHKSGADTMYKLGQCYEQIGDRGKAKKCYEHVTAYESHPLAPEAREALYRLQSG